MATRMCERLLGILRDVGPPRGIRCLRYRWSRACIGWENLDPRCGRLRNDSWSKFACTNVASAYVRLTIIVAVKRAVVNVPCMWRKHCIDDEHMMYGFPP
eukprot:COSAG06_NODE_41661_length_389_cov_0.703448_1_plen_99_part_01